MKNEELLKTRARVRTMLKSININKGTKDMATRVVIEAYTKGINALIYLGNTYDEAVAKYEEENQDAINDLIENGAINKFMDTLGPAQRLMQHIYEESIKEAAQEEGVSVEEYKQQLKREIDQ